MSFVTNIPSTLANSKDLSIDILCCGYTYFKLGVQVLHYRFQFVQPFIAAGGFSVTFIVSKVKKIEQKVKFCLSKQLQEYSC